MPKKLTRLLTKLKQPKIQRRSKTLSRTAIILSLLCASCADAQIPAWNGRLFFGDSVKHGLTRNNPNDKDFISANDPQDAKRLDDMIAMSGADFKSFMNTFIGGCKEWKTGRPGTIMITVDDFIFMQTGSYPKR